MKRIDCLGDICPIPILNLQKELESIHDGNEVTLITDHSCTLQSVNDFCAMHSLKYTVDEVITGVWEIIISK
ncbi:MAG: sulfurtransferase TusA family protein [Erysipelothrix sp.]